MLTKDNVTVGIEWRFGLDWPGAATPLLIYHPPEFRGTTTQKQFGLQRKLC